MQDIRYVVLCVTYFGLELIALLIGLGVIPYTPGAFSFALFISASIGLALEIRLIVLEHRVLEVRTAPFAYGLAYIVPIVSALVASYVLWAVALSVATFLFLFVRLAWLGLLLRTR